MSNQSDETPDQTRLRVDGTKLVDKLLEHGVKVALIQYAFTATLLYLMVTGKWRASNNTYLDVLGLQFELSLWIMVFPLANAAVNFHMWRILRQITRSIQRGGRSSAVLAMTAVQSVWFGNPFQTALSNDVRAFGPAFYGLMIFIVPHLFAFTIGHAIELQSKRSNIETILTIFTNFLFVISCYAIVGAVDNCRLHIRKALLGRKTFGKRSKSVTPSEGASS